MAIKFSCACGHRMGAPEGFAGRRAKCPACGAILDIPSASSPPPTTRPPSKTPTDYNIKPVDDHIRFHCENCGHRIGVPASFAGKMGRCPGCNERVEVPLTSLVVPQATAPSRSPTDYEMKAIEATAPAAQRGAWGINSAVAIRGLVRSKSGLAAIGGAALVMIVGVSLLLREMGRSAHPLTPQMATPASPASAPSPQPPSPIAAIPVEPPKKVNAASSPSAPETSSAPPIPAYNGTSTPGDPIPPGSKDAVTHHVDQTPAPAASGSAKKAVVHPLATVINCGSKGKDPLWDSEMDAGADALRNGNPGEAERQYGAALRESKVLADSIFTAMSLWGLGESQRAQGRNQEAERTLRRGLKIRQDLRDPRDLGLAWCQYSLGLLYEATGRLARAEMALRQAESIVEANDTGDDGMADAVAGAIVGKIFEDSILEGAAQEAVKEHRRRAEEQRQWLASAKGGMLVDLRRVQDEKEAEPPEVLAKEQEEIAKADEAAEVEGKARALLVNAQQFAVNNMRDRALSLLDEILKNYPNTDAAASAKEWLAALKDPGGKLPPVGVEGGENAGDAPSADDQAPEPCPTCGGAKGSRCTACVTGEVTTECSACRGVGRTKCPKCKGAFFLKCPCGGRNSNCPECHGTGSINCDACNGAGSLECKKCGGRGRVTGPCPACKGKRWIPCRDCDGTGIAQTPAVIAEKKAAGLLSVAKGFESNKRGDQAIEKYEELIKTYPGTRAAKEAIARLAALKPGK